jgi:hypothetical protein
MAICFPDNFLYKTGYLSFQDAMKCRFGRGKGKDWMVIHPISSFSLGPKMGEVRE